MGLFSKLRLHVDMMGGNQAAIEETGVAIEEPSFDEV
jgi:hypothetical protein